MIEPEIIPNQNLTDVPVSTPEEAPLSPTSPVTPPTKRKKKVFIIAGAVLLLILAVILTSFLLLKSSKQPSDSNGTFKLSNGKEVRLGQSTAELKQAIGLNTPDNQLGIYEYPADIKLDNPLQATFFTQNDRLVAIRVNRNEANVQTQTGIHVGMTLDDVKAKIGDQAKPIDEQLQHGAIRGLVLDGSNMATHYLVDACQHQSNKVVVILAALKGQEAKAKSVGAGCNNRGN